MQIVKDQSGRVLKLTGALGIGEAEELRNALRDFVGEASAPIVDLAEVDACDTAALQLLYSARKTADRSGKQFEFVGASAAIRDIGATLGLTLTEAPDDAVGANRAERGGEDGV